MGVFSAILGSLLGIVILAVGYLGSMWAYIKIRQRCSSNKYAVEVSIVSIAVLLSVLFKIIILYTTTDQYQLDGGIAMFFHALYSGLGGLGFEGLDGLSEIGYVWLQCFYTGTSVYASLMFVSVVSAKANYEIYGAFLLSNIRWRLLAQKLNVTKKKVDIYLFTSATEDSVILANSIYKEYQEDQEKRATKVCRIIFAGDELESFDRKNSAHRDIMSNGYVYWPYPKKKRSNLDKKAQYSSFLSRLRLKVTNQYQYTDSRIHLFAFSTDQSQSDCGLEAKNSDIIFDEIRALSYEHAVKGNVTPYVDFYVLTSAGDINYQYYERKVALVVEDVVKDSGKAIDVETYRQHFQLHVVNEAALAGECLSQERIALYNHSDNLFVEDNDPDYTKTVRGGTTTKNNIYRAIVLGFGKTGQQAMKTIYHDTAYVDQEGIPSQFVADVYDCNASDLGGLFAINHPLFVCANMDSARPIEFCGYDNLDATSPLIEKYRAIEALYATMAKEYNKTFSDVVKEMAFPVVGIHTNSCFEMPFFNYLDRHTGEESDKCGSNKTKYNCFVIALGDDELNISMANALIDDVKHEEVSGIDGVYPQTIYVNIRDERNLNRINWSKDDVKYFPRLRVVQFGSRATMYSYKTIVEDREDVKYDNMYNRVTDETNKAVFDKVTASLTDDSSKDYKTEIVELFDRLKGDFYDRALWKKVDAFKKEPNAFASRFSAYFRARFKEVEEGCLTGAVLKNYAILEHARWNRLHVASGWTYAYYTKECMDAINKEHLSATGATLYKDYKEYRNFRKSIKEHSCICPFDCLDLYTQSYDLVNVILAYKAYMQKR